MWKREILDTPRGKFEIFLKGEGEPTCITHLYSEFNELGYYFADEFTDYFKVILVNLREAGNSCKAEKEYLLSMDEAVYDLEAIRDTLGYNKWAFGGHSTGGMLGLKYGIIAQNSLTKLIVGGAAASYKYMEHPDSMYCHKSPLNKRLLEILEILKTSKNRKERVSASKEWTNMSLYNPDKREQYFKKPSSGKTIAKRLDYYSYTELPTFDLVSQLKDIIVPVFVYGGAHDAQCPFVFSEEIHLNLHNAVLFKFNFSNHSPFMEEKEKFKQMISKFKILDSEHIL